jgi:hypothetical protein
MAAELKATNPAVNIEILGVNMSTDAAYNPLVTAERTLPWLQDNFDNSAWDAWKVTWRDVRILNGRNELLYVYNLTINDLSIAANRSKLKQMFLSAAAWVDSDHDGLSDDWELLQFGNLSMTASMDPDGDGADNFSEYAFGTNPLNSSSKPAFTSVVRGNDVSRQFGLVFQRRAGRGLNYYIEASPDLVQWTAEPAVISVTEPFTNFYDGTGMGRSEYRLTAPIPNQSAGFLRMRAVPIP